jgi:hypothetical protein
LTAERKPCQTRTRPDGPAGFRIEALKRFPKLVQLMNAEAKAAVAAIEAAKKPVK